MAKIRILIVDDSVVIRRLLSDCLAQDPVVASSSVPRDARGRLCYTRSLPQEVRSGGIGIIYAVAITVFGGSASFVVAWLTEVTGSPLAPAWYMCAALAFGVCAMLAVRETAPIKTGR